MIRCWKTFFVKYDAEVGKGLMVKGRCNHVGGDGFSGPVSTSRI